MKVYSVDSLAWVQPSDAERSSLRAALTLRSPDGTKELKMYQEVGRLFGIPRNYFPYQGLEVPVNPDWHIDITDNIVLKPEQEKTLRAFGQHLKANPYGGIIKSATGSGKTVIGIKLISMLKLRTLVVVPTERIMQQWIQQVKLFTNLDGNDIGVIRGDKCIVKDRKVVIGMIHTLAKDRLDIHDLFGNVIVDEVHTISAPTFSTVAGLFVSKVRIGLSATPRRKDGMANVFKWHIGDVGVTSSIENAVPKVIRLNYFDPASCHNGCVFHGDLSLGRYMNKIAPVAKRNAEILKLVVTAYKNKHNILVLSDRIEQLELFKSLLSTIPELTGKVGMLTGKVKDVDKTIILGTYGSAGMGLDIPRLSCVVLATPRTDIEQAVGRVLRIKETTVQPYVIDIVDSSSSIMRGWGAKRMSYYKSKGMQVVERNVNVT